MKAVFFGKNPSTFDRVYGDKQRQMLGQRVELYPEVCVSLNDAALRDADVLFSTWGMLSCTAEEIRRYLPKVKAVFYAAGSVQAFAAPFLDEGVRVYSAWNANAVPVTQFAFSQILLSLEGYFRVQPETRTNRAAAAELQSHYPGVFDVKVGLLGCGAIGSRLAKMLSATDAEVLVYDPFLEKERADRLGVRKASLEEIFSSCDVVSNHVANLPETAGLIKREHLLSMKPYATFINTGRGQQLDEKDLFDMLTRDTTRTALLDVMTEEEYSDTNPLNKLPNCFITPHIAGSTGNEVRRMAEYMVEAFDSFAAGESSRHEVTQDMLEHMA